MKSLYIILITVIIFSGSILNAGTRYSITNGNWSSTNTWASSSGGPNGASVPVSGDIVIVEQGFNVTVDISNAICGSVQLGSPTSGNGAGILTFNSGSQLTVSGAMTLGNTGSISRFGTITMSAGGKLICASMTSNSTNDVFTEGTGTVQFTGTFNLRGTDVAGQLGSFNNLEVNGGTVTLSNNVSVTTNLSLLTGTLSIGANTLTINGSITTTSGILTGGNSSSISVGGPGASTALPLVTLSTLTLNRANGISLGGNVTASTLNMTSGNITTGTNTLTLGTSTANLGTLSRTTGTIIGKFARWFAASTSVSRLFPVGTSTNYRPVDLSFTSAPSAGGTLTAEHIASNPGINNTSPIDDNGYSLNTYSQIGYWRMTVGNGLTGGVYSIDFTMSGIVGVSNVTKLHMIKRSLSSDPWAAPGTFVAGSGTNTNPTISRTTLSGFSEFGIASNSADNTLDSPLPVQLSSFNYSMNGRDVNLSWVTTSETNNTGFDVERALDINQNLAFSKVGYVGGKGNTNSSTSYNFSDARLITGKYKYRLKQIDFNGNFEYFDLNDEVVVGVPAKFSISQNYPNPFNPTTKIDFDLPFDSKVNIVLFDLTGKEVKTLVNESRTAGFNTVNFNAADLPSGTYFYRIVTKSSGVNFVATKKMLLVK